MINTQSIKTIFALSIAAMILFSLPLAWHMRQPLQAFLSAGPVQASEQR